MTSRDKGRFNIVLIIALASAVGLAACNAGGQAAPQTVSPTSTSVAETAPTSASQPTPTAAPRTTAVAEATTTTVDPKTPPYPNTADLDDPTEVWQALLAYHNWIFQNPESADLDRYLDEACACYGYIQDQIDRLVANGWTEDDEGIIFDHLTVHVESEQGWVVTVFDRHVELRIVDGDGNLVETREERPLSSFAVTLFKDQERGYVIREWTFKSQVD